MDVGLVKNGVIENVVTVDSLENAQELFPGFDSYLERVPGVAFGPGWRLDGPTLSEPLAAPAKKTEYSHIEFMKMLPPEVLGGVLYTEKLAPGQAGFDASLLVAMEFFRRAGVVNVRDPDTIRFVGYLSQAYGLAPEKAAEILAGV